MSKHERKRKKKFLNRRAHKNRIYVATSWHATVMFSGIPLEKKKQDRSKPLHCYTGGGAFSIIFHRLSRGDVIRGTGTNGLLIVTK